MDGTRPITHRDVKREARWLREAGHTFAAGLLEALWREPFQDGRAADSGRAPMTAGDLAGLRAGDIVRSRATGESYVVAAGYGDRATAVRTADITNPAEWERATDVE